LNDYDNAVPRNAALKEQPLERLRSLCLTLPEASSRLTWGDVMTYRVKDKIFVLVETEGQAFWCKSTSEFQALLIGSDAERFFSPPYLGGRGWIGMRLAGADWNAVAALVEESYCRVAPKKLAVQVQGRLERVAG
jgi:predicted DNA-binding protein (MmcQ/YjbR family)